MVAAAESIVIRKVARPYRRYSHGSHISVIPDSLKKNSRIEYSQHPWSVIERSENHCLTPAPDSRSARLRRFATSFRKRQ